MLIFIRLPSWQSKNSETRIISIGQSECDCTSVILLPCLESLNDRMREITR